MRRVRAKAVLLLLGGALALGLVALTWAIGAGSSEAQQGAMHNCPQAGKWAISVWAGPDGADTGEALATCGGGAVAAAYYLVPEDQTWQRWFAGRPLVSTLETLNDMQGVIALGAVSAPPPSPTLTPTPTSWREIGVESIWTWGDKATHTRLHDCSRERRTECVTTIMQESGASPQAMDFFRMTGWFLGEFQEMGTVDLASIVNPWLVNENVQYAFVNGTPLIVHPEEDVWRVAIELDPNYEELVASFPDLFLWPGRGLFEGLSARDQGGQRFVLQFHLVDGCHACRTGYFARVAFDFGPDGTYLWPYHRTLGLCWGGGVYPPDFVGPRVTPVSASVPDCPLP